MSPHGHRPRQNWSTKTTHNMFTMMPPPRIRTIAFGFCSDHNGIHIPRRPEHTELLFQLVAFSAPVNHEESEREREDGVVSLILAKERISNQNSPLLHRPPMPVHHILRTLCPVRQRPLLHWPRRRCSLSTRFSSSSGLLLGWQGLLLL